MHERRRTQVELELYYILISSFNFLEFLYNQGCYK